MHESPPEPEPPADGATPVHPPAPEPALRLRDLPLAVAVEAPATATIGEVTARSGEWVVVTGTDGQPVGAVPAARLAGEPADTRLDELLAELPPAIVAPATTPLDDLRGSWAVGEAGPASPVIVTDEGVTGVLAGPQPPVQFSFRDLSELGPPYYAGAELPGYPLIPAITKACQYQDDAGGCTAVLEFAERPDEPDPCPNPAGLGDHDFAW